MLRRRWTLVVLAALIVAAAAALLIRRAIDPATLRAAAEARLTAMLGQPVAIGELSVSLAPPSVAGTNVRVGRPPTGTAPSAPALELRSIRLFPQLWSLISRPAIIEEIQLEGLTLSILRDREGRWLLPAAVPAPTADAERGIVIERVRMEDGQVRVFDESAAGQAREAASVDALSAEMFAEDTGLRFESIAGRIGTASIEGTARLDAERASVDLELSQIADGDLEPLLRLAGTARPNFLHLAHPATVALRVQIDRASSRLSGTGRVRAPQVVVGPLRLDDLAAPLAVEGTRLTFAPTTFAVSGGRYEGPVALDLSRTPPRWSIDSTVSELDAGQFLSALAGRDQRVDGKASIRAALRGIVGEALARTMEGRVTVRVADGVIREFPLLATLNRTLRLAEGDARDTRFERLSAAFSVEDGWATTDDLLLVAQEVRVEARGRIGFDRTLDLAGRAVLSPERSARAIRSVHELAALRNEQGELVIPLTITGTADAPTIALDLQAAITRSLKEELRRRLRGIIRPPG
jgi:uncharacterized protein involved in outer membrane biogenesis